MITLYKFQQTKNFGLHLEQLKEPDILFRMPAGEWHIKSAPSEATYGLIVAYVQLSGSIGEDLTGLAIIKDALDRQGLKLLIVIPYLPGARQDRFQPGEAFSAKVYAKLINGIGAEKVLCLDPHSDVMPALIDNCVVTDIRRAVANLSSLITGVRIPLWDGVIAPDAGAAKRAQKIADLLNIPLFQATKKRDPDTGKLSKFGCEDIVMDGLNLLVVDDICDRGGTFIGLAEAIRAQKPSMPIEADPDRLVHHRLDLWVTHGVFAPGSEKLREYYRYIFTTDSCLPQTQGVVTATVKMLEHMLES
jgi:ribose-phosphate pyrophosphokinase